MQARNGKLKNVGYTRKDRKKGRLDKADYKR